MRPLSVEELVELTGKKRHSSQASALTMMKVPYRVRPDGSVVVIDTDLPLTVCGDNNQSVNLDLGAV